MYLWWEMQLKMFADKEHLTRRMVLKGLEGVGDRLQSVFATRCRNSANGCSLSAMHLAANIYWARW
jgi:hypothetical protein